ncbi:O-antigen ligase [Bradyrhizobium sp. MOS002]|uniref:O-antigen ligase family protein n=1 Tax=Bradyrhizobium sp. MOS002 TaxID=2133947 RepID=UPI0011B1F2B3|nr:O-antigen ligase family protein [Bradyrhizobium sp. MOS002]
MRIAAIWVSISFALISNVIPFFRGENADDAELVYETARSWQLAGLLALVLAAALLGRFRVVKTRAFLFGVSLALYLVLNSSLSALPEVSLTYASIFMFILLLISMLRLEAIDWLRIFRITSLVLAPMLIFFVATKQLQDRYVGAIHPNIMGTWIFVIAVLAAAWASWVRWPICGAAIAIGVIVDSRFSVLGSILFIAAFWVFSASHSPRKALLAVIGAAVVIAVLSETPLVGFIAGEGERSLTEGGISGRTELWDASYARILEHPLLGSGFRATVEAQLISHSGLLTLIEELGLIGLVLFAVLIALRSMELFQTARYSQSPDTRHLSSILLAGLIANAVPFAFQPNYLNFGDPLGLLMLMILFTNIPAPASSAIALSERNRAAFIASAPPTTHYARDDLSP